MASNIFHFSTSRAEQLNIPIPVPLSLEQQMNQMLINVNRSDDVEKKLRLLDSMPKNVHYQPEFSSYKFENVKHLQEQENLFRVPQNFLDDRQIDHTKRIEIVNWLKLVVRIFKIQKSIFYRAVHFMDRYTAKGPPFDADQYRPVAMACLNLASKVEIQKPIMNMLLGRLKVCSKEELVLLERQIYKTLDFDLTFPVPHDYVDLFLCAVPKTDFLEQRGQEVKDETEALLTEWTHLSTHYPASHVAALAVCKATSKVQTCRSAEEQVEVEDETLRLWTNLSTAETVKNQQYCQLEGGQYRPHPQ